MPVRLMYVRQVCSGDLLYIIEISFPSPSGVHGAPPTRTPVAPPATSEGHHTVTVAVRDSLHKDPALYNTQDGNITHKTPHRVVNSAQAASAILASSAALEAK